MSERVNQDIVESQESKLEREEDLIGRIDKLEALCGALSLLAAEGVSLPDNHQYNYVQVLDEQVQLLRRAMIQLNNMS